MIDFEKNLLVRVFFAQFNCMDNHTITYTDSFIVRC